MFSVNCLKKWTHFERDNGFFPWPSVQVCCYKCSEILQQMLKDLYNFKNLECGIINCTIGSEFSKSFFFLLTTFSYIHAWGTDKS